MKFNLFNKVKKDVYGMVEDLMIGEINLQGVKFNAYKDDGVVAFISGNYNYYADYDENITLSDLLIETIKNTPIERKSNIKTNVYFAYFNENSGEKFDKLLNIEIKKSELDGFVSIFSEEYSKSFDVQLCNIELIETIYEPIFKDL
jgi:hypothetical protein